MKKKQTYTCPKLQIVAFQTQTLLAGSFIETLDDNNPITASDEIFAPELELTIGEKY